MRSIAAAAAIAKCRSCKHGQYRPRDIGKRVAYNVEAIKCDEGIFGMPHDFRRRGGFSATFTHWLWTGAITRHYSKVRDTILLCGFYEATPPGAEGK